MRCLKFVSRHLVVACVVGLGLSACQVAVAADAPVADKVIKKDKVERGKFVSFQDGVLTIRANSGELLQNKISKNTNASVWNYDEDLYQPADASQALSQLTAGKWIVVRVSGENMTLLIGARKGHTIGTFVSFQDNRLLLLSKNLGERFTKKYGNNVHFNRFREDVPVYESIDGGEYQLVKGATNKILQNVKEGTIITVDGEGDDNILSIQIGVPKKQ